MRRSASCAISSPATPEKRHLACAAKGWMHVADIEARDRVAVACGHPVGPLAEAVAGPLEVMAGMAEAVSGHAENRVILGIGGGHDDVAGAHVAEECPLQPVEIRKWQMLDRLDQTGAIVAAQGGMPGGHRGMRYLHLCACGLG